MQNNKETVLILKSILKYSYMGYLIFLLSEEIQNEFNNS